jgi:hypothetical protein
MRLTLLGLGLCVGFALTACGGGGGGNTATVMILGTDGLCGYVTQTGTVATPQSTLLVGELVLPPPTPEQGIRGFLSFDLSSIPSGAPVVSATLRVQQNQVSGDPYTALGPLLLDQVVYGTVLDAGAYDRSFPTNQAFAMLATDTTLGPKETDVTVAVQDDLAAPRTRSQFRLRFAIDTNGDGLGTAARFDGPLSANPPLLIVTYRK